VKRIRLTSKRQATFSKELCEEMGLEPGDSLLADARVVDGERVWIVRSARDAAQGWFAALRRYARGKRHDMKSVRASMRKARKSGRV
jgi:bifunctional DNA-binding transcriptional regulator/antitoxin component of YhaV-PrlF toxin-antitoxin module